MHRFFVPPSHITDGRIILPDHAAHQLARVLRSRPGDTIAVLDNSGTEYIVRLDAVSAHSASGIICDQYQGSGEPRLQITLYQGLLKSDKLEYVLQKATELGVQCFVPFICERTIRRNIPTPGRTERWQRIIREAAEQSGRCKLPELKSAVDFSQAVDSINEPAVLAWECERTTGLRQALTHLKARHNEGDVIQRISIIIGSEGGLTDAEAAYANTHGITSVSLGSRILRADTAGIAAIAATLYEMGEMGG